MARARAARPLPPGDAVSEFKVASDTEISGIEPDDKIIVVDDLPDMLAVSNREARTVEIFLGHLIDDLLREIDAP